MTNIFDCFMCVCSEIRRPIEPSVGRIVRRAALLPPSGLDPDDVFDVIHDILQRLPRVTIEPLALVSRLENDFGTHFLDASNHD
jgi:hypothetical protein